jgi:hypothetical protein
MQLRCLSLPQAVEEEQEGLLEQQQQHSRKLHELQQQHQPGAYAGSAVVPLPSAFAAAAADMAPSMQQTDTQQALRAECGFVAAALSAAAGVPFPALKETECMTASCYEDDSADAGLNGSSSANAQASAELQPRAPCMPFAVPEVASMVPSDVAEAEVSTQGIEAFWFYTLRTWSEQASSTTVSSLCLYCQVASMRVTPACVGHWAYTHAS